MSKSKAIYSRRRVGVCREGWYYLFVLAFIAGGAILRQVNPLFALAAVMVGPMLFNWRVAMSSINRLSVRRRYPDQISAGEDLRVDIVLHNRRTRLDSYTVHIRDQLTLVEPAIRAYQTKADCVVAKVPVGGSASSSYRCYLNRRGRYRFGPMLFSTRYPIGMIVASRLLRSKDEIIVAPRLGKLTPSWNSLVFRTQAGQQTRSSRQGSQEGDFFALRQWQVGDSKRWIHWRTTARQGELMVKQFEQQNERDLAIVLDLWQSATPQSEEKDRVELAASFVTTALMETYHQASGNITLGLAGETSEQFSSQTTPSFLRESLTRLALIQPSSTGELPRIVREVSKLASPHSRIVVISTRNITAETLAEAERKTAPDGEHSMSFAEIANRLVAIDVGDKEQMKRLIHYPQEARQ